MIFVYMLVVFFQILPAMESYTSVPLQIKNVMALFDHACYEAYPGIFENLRNEIIKLDSDKRKSCINDLKTLGSAMIEKAPSKMLIYGDLCARFSVTQGPALALMAYLRDFCTVSEFDCSFRVAATAGAITLGGIAILSGWGSHPRKALFAHSVSHKIAELAAAIESDTPIGESGVLA